MSISWRHHVTLRWRHNGHDGVSNHQPHHCLLNLLFGCRSKKTPKIRVTGLCAGKSPESGELPAEMASNAENASIWWRHHEFQRLRVTSNLISQLLDTDVQYPFIQCVCPRSLLALQSCFNMVRDQRWPHWIKGRCISVYVCLSVRASQITSLAIVYSTVYSGADQRKNQSSASLAFVRGIPRQAVNSPHKEPVTRKMFPIDDVIMKRLFYNATIRRVGIDLMPFASLHQPDLTKFVHIAICFTMKMRS